MKDDLETNCMNELFDGGNEDDSYYNWFPVSNTCSEKIRELIPQDKLEWIKREKGLER